MELLLTITSGWIKTHSKWRILSFPVLPKGMFMQILSKCAAVSPVRNKHKIRTFDNLHLADVNSNMHIDANKMTVNYMTSIEF